MKTKKKNKQLNLPKTLKKTLCFLLSFVFMFSIFATGGVQASAASIKTTKITSVTAKSSTAVKIKWKKVSGVKGYVIYQKANNGSYKKIKTIDNVNKTTYVKTDLNSATKYSYKISTYKTKNGKKTYSAKSNEKYTYTKPMSPEITYIKSTSKTSITIKWEKIEKANGYAIYRKTGGDYNRVATIKDKNTTSYKIKNLKSGKKYTYIVRAYITKNGKNIYSLITDSASTYTQHTHKYTKKVVKPTCNKQGYTLNKCFCGKSYKSNFTEPKHNFENYECTECGEIDTSNAYEYLKKWVIKNGEVSGAFINIYDGEYGISYNANGDYIYLNCGLFLDNGDYQFHSIKLHNYEYFTTVCEDTDYLYDDYVEGVLDANTFTDNTPITYTNHKNTYYQYTSLIDVTRTNIVDMLNWLSAFLYEEGLPITLYDLGFKSFE